MKNKIKAFVRINHMYNIKTEVTVKNENEIRSKCIL